MVGRGLPARGGRSEAEKTLIVGDERSVVDDAEEDMTGDDGEELLPLPLPLPTAESDEAAFLRFAIVLEE